MHGPFTAPTRSSGLSHWTHRTRVEWPPSNPRRRPRDRSSRSATTASWWPKTFFLRYDSTPSMLCRPPSVPGHAPNTWTLCTACACAQGPGSFISGCQPGLTISYAGSAFTSCQFAQFSCVDGPALYFGTWGTCSLYVYLSCRVSQG
jgi:hypothetical protein